MKTLRNLAFLTFASVMFVCNRGELLASWTPPIGWCPDGCTCTVTENNWLEVTGECPDVASADACPWVFYMCTDYCDLLGGYLAIEYPPYSYSCGFYELLDGCEPPYGLDPPTNPWTCGCYCWVS
jgi:hypothetical protein